MIYSSTSNYIERKATLDKAINYENQSWKDINKYAYWVLMQMADLYPDFDFRFRFVGYFSDCLQRPGCQLGPLTPKRGQ